MSLDSVADPGPDSAPTSSGGTASARDEAGLRRRVEGVVREVVALDQSVYGAVASEPTPTLDARLRRLSRAADHSVLWLGIAAALATRPGAGRRAAAHGVVSIALASLVTNVAGKTLVRRPRPDRASAMYGAARHVPLPASPSFPSGHAASAFAFASAVGDELPALSLPLQLLAGAVAYSRVHTGVHFPLDTLVGASVGVAAASGVSQVVHQRWPAVPAQRTGTGR